MIEATFSTKGNTTKQIKKILGAGFAVRTNATCTIVTGDLEEARELLAGYSMLYGTKEVCDQLWVWPR